MTGRRTRVDRYVSFGVTALASVLLLAIPVGAQNTYDDLHDGPLIEGFGRHVDLPDADFETRTDQVYKVAFELFQPLGRPERVHMRLEAAARFMNMHAHAGVPKDNLQVKLILHGGGTQAAMTNEAYRKRHDVDNPNLPLLQALSDAGVEIFLCEQSRVLNGLAADQVAAPVKSALSAYQGAHRSERRGSGDSEWALDTRNSGYGRGYCSLGSARNGEVVHDGRCTCVRHGPADRGGRGGQDPAARGRTDAVHPGRR